MGKTREKQTWRRKMGSLLDTSGVRWLSDVQMEIPCRQLEMQIESSRQRYKLGRTQYRGGT